MQPIDRNFRFKLSLLVSLIALILIQGCNQNNDEPIPEPTLCLEGEFIGHNPFCKGVVDNQLTKLYTIRILQDSLVTIQDVDLPESFRVAGEKIYFSIDSIGSLSSCDFLGGALYPPLRVSNVSTIPCDNEDR